MITSASGGRWVRGRWRDARERMSGRDTALVAAGLTFYSSIAVVPILLLALWGASRASSARTVVESSESVGRMLPDGGGARGLLAGLVDAGVNLGWIGAAVCLFPASFYGEGIRRASMRYLNHPARVSAFRGRVAAVPVMLVSPLLMWLLLEAGAAMHDLTRAGTAPLLVLRVWLGLVVVWLVLTPVLAWAYRVIAPAEISWGSAAVGGTTAAAFVSGFLQGFVLFLAIPFDLGRPFGGLSVVGVVIALGFWLWLLHLVVLTGWALTLALSTRRVATT